MTGCLRERTLWRLHQGEGTSAQWDHLARCGACDARYLRLAGDLETIGRVLAESTPPALGSSRARWPRGRVARAAAAALAVSVALVAGNMWGRWQTAPAHPVFPPREEALAFLEEVSAALFVAGDAGEAVIAVFDPGLGGLPAGPEG